MSLANLQTMFALNRGVTPDSEMRPGISRVCPFKTVGFDYPSDILPTSHLKQPREEAVNQRDMAILLLNDFLNAHYQETIEQRMI